jgi:hypothetical protein
MRFITRIFAIAALITAVVYIGGYSIFSFFGRYHEVTIEGGVQYAVWFPYSFGYISKHPKQQMTIYNDAMIFAPLIWVDRKLIHSSIMTVSMNGDEHRIASISSDGKKVKTEQGAAANP